jgi:hypothetical protein
VIRKPVWIALAIGAAVAFSWCAWSAVRQVRQASRLCAGRVVSIRVGTNTVEDLEQILGPGAPCLGGHPNGGRVWFLKPQRVYIYVDGFDYVRNGELIDEIRVGHSRDDAWRGPCYGMPPPAIPKANARVSGIGWSLRALPWGKRSLSRLDIVTTP